MMIRIWRQLLWRLRRQSLRLYLLLVGVDEKFVPRVTAIPKLHPRFTRAVAASDLVGNG